MATQKKTGGRVIKMSPLTIARIEAELLDLTAELKARVPDIDAGHASGPQEAAAPDDGAHPMIAAIYARPHPDRHQEED